MAARDTMGVQALAWPSPPALTLPTRHDAQLSNKRSLEAKPLSSSTSFFPPLGILLRAWVVPILPPTHPRPRAYAPLPHSTAPQSLLREGTAPNADLGLPCLQNPSSVTLGAHYHSPVRHCLCSSNEDGHQVRDIINNNNG